ncbi:hypothetical protein G5I_02893 [Acromyrmex echinatior]|uniref:Uncharacterized protein n=1 Tax=Acromyrmex echinatior TaxID=103372 RepID=F4WBI1_ACREC|nr:hypothetical protein G5I_02893 [Acromyrmex echinatior]
MHTAIAPVTASIAEQLPRYSLHAQQTGTTLPPLAVPFLFSYRTNNLELKLRSDLAHFVYVGESANSRIDNEKSIEKTLEKEKPRLKKRLKNLAPRFARWHASNWNGQTDERTVSEEAQPAVPDGGLPRHWRLLSLPGHSPKGYANKNSHLRSNKHKMPSFIPRICYERMMCSQLANGNPILATRVYTKSSLSNLLTPILECLLTTAEVTKNHTDLSRANCFVVADEPPGSSSIVHERKPSFAHIGPQNSQTSLCDRWNSLSLRLIGQFAKQSESIIFSCLEVFWGRLDEFLSESDVSMKRIVLQFQSLLEQSKLNGDVTFDGNFTLVLEKFYVFSQDFTPNPRDLKHVNGVSCLSIVDDRIEEVELLRIKLETSQSYFGVKIKQFDLNILLYHIQRRKKVTLDS